ncbi:16S rRNA (uracil(1498)-N(3))-methyltransferase [Candidatus Peregrinibacteria bacterium]|nr:16S rRNA (uracil(1498)-N(3))-methyltransferase [Candidatus Peregrinibacteria bacterium]
MHRFFVPDLRIQDRLATLSAPALVHQLHRVLRMRAGGKFALFDGHEAVDHLMTIVEIDALAVQVQLLESRPNLSESSRTIHLFQAIPKKPALFDLILQKATEIGVTHFYPLITERTENRKLSKLERRQAIVVEATEQCGRARVPQIHSPIAFADAISHVGTQNFASLLGYEFAKGHSLLDLWPLIEKQREIALFIGPEGGFTEKEIELAEQQQTKIFSLGKRILRVETASIAALSLLLLSHLE